jgi:hypothetical protein
VAGNSTLLQPLSNSDRRAMAWSRSHTGELSADLRETPDLQVRYDEDSVVILGRR